MNELSLFTGAGGGILASILLNWTTIGYVEYDKYCQQIIRQRIRDGIYDDAPIFGDIKGFDGKRWRGIVDIITSGFPCQPFSVAGKRAGADDPRNMWPETLRVICEVRPRFVFLENVPGLLSARQKITLLVIEKIRQLDLFGAGSKNSRLGRYIRRIETAYLGAYAGRVLGDLAEIGYDAEWCVLGADDCGAPHRRKRLWILAYSVSDGSRSRGTEREGQQRRVASIGSSDVADTPGMRGASIERDEQNGILQNNVPDASESGLAQRGNVAGRTEGRESHCSHQESEELADPSIERERHLSGRPGHAAKPGEEYPGTKPAVSGSRITWWDTDPADVPDTPSGGQLRAAQPQDDGEDSKGRRGYDADDEDKDTPRLPSIEGRSVESFVGLLANELAPRIDELRTSPLGYIPRVATNVRNRVSRLKAIGNGQVPLTAVAAWHLLRKNIET